MFHVGYSPALGNTLKYKLDDILELLYKFVVFSPLPVYLQHTGESTFSD